MAAQELNKKFHWGTIMAFLTAFQILTSTLTIVKGEEINFKLFAVFSAFIAAEWLYMIIASTFCNQNNFELETLEESGRPSWLIYLSDHGETPSSKNWRTATDRDLWDIPFVVWTSKEFKEKYPEKVLKLTAAKDKPLQSDQLLYGLLDFAGVEGLGIEPCENFLDEEFRPRRPRLIQGGKSIYSWD